MQLANGDQIAPLHTGMYLDRKSKRKYMYSSAVNCYRYKPTTTKKEGRILNKMSVPLSSENIFMCVSAINMNSNSTTKKILIMYVINGAISFFLSCFLYIINCLGWIIHLWPSVLWTPQFWMSPTTEYFDFQQRLSDLTFTSNWVVWLPPTVE